MEIEHKYITDSNHEKILGVYMSCRQRKVIMNAFIKSQFGHCPLLWMFPSRSLHTHINKIHERALHILYKDNNFSFEQVLKISGSVTIHHKNLQVLATEVCFSRLFNNTDIKCNLCKGNTLVSKIVKLWS